MTNTGIYQWFCLWRWCKMYNPGCVFVFFCFYLGGKQILSKCRTSTDASLRADVPISTAACVFYSLTCLATMIQLGHLSATQLKQVIMLSMCESPLPTADTQRYLFWLRAEGLWNMSFHLLPAAVNGACVNTQRSSRLCFEIFLCVGIPQHYGLQRNVSHGTLCYLWVAGSTICQQARRVSIWRFAKMSFPGFVDKS